MLNDGVIQVAGVIDREEADLLQRCGVRYLGFPLRLPVHRPDLSEEEAAAVIRSLRPSVHAILITYLDSAVEIIGLCHFLGVRIVQLHGEIDVAELARLKATDPGLVVIKSLVVGLQDEAELVATMRRSSAFVDGFITDTFDPATGACGATGKTHDWALSRRLVKRSQRPVILAGGLTPDNVRAAIAEVRPAGVDVHTGVEDDAGRKSCNSVRRFVAEARAGFGELRIRRDPFLIHRQRSPGQ